MSSERWRQIERIYHGALARDERERGSYLREACAGDETLQREVESLLAHERTAEGFLKAPAVDAAAQMLVVDQSAPLIGRTLGSYRILSLLGAGGMGEVYRARDTKLGREVAVKVLPAFFAHDPERFARFEREARLLAALNHPHIAVIYGLEEFEGLHGLVLELVEGPTLADRVSAGAVPVKEALSIARQIAEALEASHEKGIIHRDLKPGNIKITDGGTVKVLDFGLAKALVGEAAGPDLSQLPTVTVGGTYDGVILGTPAYMSPEQARGKMVDKRTDIWAFGCLLYEMLTGRVAFAGETLSDTIASILEREPKWAALPDKTPATIRRLLQRCLEKDPRRRLHDIADARIELDDAVTAPAVDAADQGAERHPLALRNPVALVVIVGLMALAAGVALLSVQRARVAETTAVPSATLALPLSVPISTTIDARTSTLLALSPDGSRLAYVGRQGETDRLFVRRLNETQVTALEGTDQARKPFFSPDGQWIVFVAGGGELKRVHVDRGAPVILARETVVFPGWWEPDDSIVYSRGNSLARVATAGQRAGATLPPTPTDVSRYSQLAPVPGGNTVVASVRFGGNTLLDDESSIVALSLRTGETRTLVDRGGSPRVVRSRGPSSELGHLVYAYGDQVWAVPFHLTKVELTGPAVPVVQNVLMRPNGDGAQYSISNTGTLVYLDASLVSELIWFERNGTQRLLSRAQRPFAMPRLSPDGRRLAVEIQDVPHQLWLLDVEREALSRLTFEHPTHYFAWHPRGDGLLFTSSWPDRRNRLAWKWADRPGDEVIVYDDPALSPWVGSWSRDGKRVSIHSLVAGHGQDVFVLPLDGGAPPKVTGQPLPVATSRFNERDSVISPDGQCVAYNSDETARWDVYIQCLDQGTQLQVSTEGGREPVWSASGSELYFRSGRQVMVAPVQRLPKLRVGSPQVALAGDYGDYMEFNPANFDVSRDGNRFVRVRPAEAPGTQYLNIRFNWFEDLNRLAPTK